MASFGNKANEKYRRSSNEVLGKKTCIYMYAVVSHTPLNKQVYITCKRCDKNWTLSRLGLPQKIALFIAKRDRVTMDVHPFLQVPVVVLLEPVLVGRKNFARLQVVSDGDAFEYGHPTVPLGMSP